MTTREYWVNTMLKIAMPVLKPLSEGNLRKEMPVDTILNERRTDSTYLEAFGRTMTGITPWLNSKNCSKEEEEKKREVLELIHKCLKNMSDPKSSDKMNFLDDDNGVYQPIVDAAFLALGLIRGYETVWKTCPEDTKKLVIAAMKASRAQKPWYSNWLLFSAVIEAFLYLAEGECDRMRIDYALKEFTKHWYVGDGCYSDGEAYHCDYYNSFVIQPMLLCVLDTVSGMYDEWVQVKDLTLKRARRYATILEKMISPEGTFPITGRSICYRMGAFHHLADIALREQLEEDVSPASVRCALTQIIERCTTDDNFDEKGYLKIGLCSYQPSMREEYITTGSLYLCESVFLPLGLSPDNAFWSDKDEKWSSAKIWSGEDFKADHSADF